MRERRGKRRLRISDFGFRVRIIVRTRARGRIGPMEPEMNITFRASVNAPACKPMLRSVDP